MIFLFLSSFIFSIDMFDTHPAIIESKDTFSVEKVRLKTIFGPNNKLLKAFLDAAAGKITSALEKWKELNEKYKADEKLLFSQGYLESSAYEFFCCICLLSVHPAASSFFEFFDATYDQAFKNKPFSPSLLMLLSVLTQNPVQNTLHAFKAIIGEIPDEEKDPITAFGLFHAKCSLKFGLESLLVQYMGDDVEEEDEERECNDAAEAAEVTRRLEIEDKIIKHFHILIAAQADRAE